MNHQLLRLISGGEIQWMELSHLVAKCDLISFEIFGIQFTEGEERNLNYKMSVNNNNILLLFAS